MIRLIDGTEWNDDDYHAQVAKRHGWTRSQAKNYMLIQNYSETMMPAELYGATRAGGKGTMLAEEIISACNDLPRGSVLYMGRGRGKSKSVLDEAQMTKLIGSGRPRMLPQQRIVWDEMGLFDWAAPESKSYCRVTRITRNAITLEMKDAEDQAPGIHPIWSTGRGRHGPRTARARADRARVSELLLHRRGSDIPELLRGIRARTEAISMASARLFVNPRGNDKRRIHHANRA